MDTQESSMKVLMLPWLAHGHISPYLELAKKLTTKNFHVYLCSTPINFISIKKKIPQNYSLSIELVEFHLPTLPDLPPHHHTTNGLPPNLMPTLKLAYKMASPKFSHILKTLTPDLVIYDYNQPWAAATAAANNIPAVQFQIVGTVMISFCFHMSHLPDVEFPFPAIRLKKHFRQTLLGPGSASVEEESDHEGIIDAIKRSHKIILFNTCRELEGKYIDYLSSLTQKKIVPMGPFVQEFVGETEQKEIMQWLDKKKESSTVFVAFGSEYFLTKEEREVVAHGLETSGVNFIWVVRFPMGEKTNLEEALPKGFLERVRERGLVVEGWAPQAQILAHSSIGGFVSHCGWNSLLETLSLGVPIIAMPMQIDQPLNARLAEEVGVGVEVERDENGRLNGEAIAQVIRKVVVEKSGEGVRIKAREVSENIRVKGDDWIDEVVAELVQICKEMK